MPDDLPAIDPNLDAPLPQVDPNSQLVPYRMARTDPGQQPVVTTGYGPRARLAIQPPAGFGGGVGFPNLDQIANAAFSNLPVDQAIKAVEAATRYIGLRGYQNDLQNGQNAAQAFAKWGPMLFRQATGIPEAIDRSVPTPITPYQKAQLKFRQQQEDDKLAAEQAKAKAPTIHPAAGGLYRVGATGPAEELVAPKPTKTTMDPEDRAELTDAYKQLDESRKDMAKLVATPPLPKNKKQHQEALDDATMRMRDARVTISRIAGGTPQEPTNFAPKETQAAPPPNPAGTNITPVITHRYDPATGKFTEVK